MNANAIEVVNLCKRYKKESLLVLDEVSFSVPRGSFFALLGLNGAGKSTLINILSGLCRADSGSVNIMGLDYQQNSLEVRRLMGLMPQEINMQPFVTVAEVLNNHVGYYGLSPHLLKEWIDHLLERLDLMRKKHTQVFKLSGGMKRRLMLARALSTRPKVALLDEPTAGVDVGLRHEIYDFLREINQSGTSIVLTTHYLEEADKLCSDYVLLSQGKIVSQGLITDIRGQTPFCFSLMFKHLPDLLVLPEGAERVGSLQWDVVLPLQELASVFQFIGDNQLELVHIELKSQLESYFQMQTAVKSGEVL